MKETRGSVIIVVLPHLDSPLIGFRVFGSCGILGLRVWELGMQVSLLQSKHCVGSNWSYGIDEAGGTVAWQRHQGN